jgi:hypothetical protein
MRGLLKGLNKLLLLSAAIVATAPEKAAEPKAVADADLATWVDTRIEERQPTSEDRRFDQIGWFKDVRTGEKLAREHQRPLFLFTHDGRMNVGRC